MAEESGRITSTIPAALTNFRTNHFTNAQPLKIPQIFPGFHSEFGGSGSEPLRLPPWLDQQVNNSQLHNHPLNFTTKPPSAANFSSSDAVDMFGSQQQETQWLNFRFPAETSFPGNSNNNNNNNLLLLPHGLKQEEQEENKGDHLSHSHSVQVSSLYLSNHQNQLQQQTHMGSMTARINDDDNTVVPSFNNIVEVQKLFKQADENSNLNRLVSLETSGNNNNNNDLGGGGGYLLNDHPLSMMGNEQELHSSSDNKNQLRDFLGVGVNSISRPFLLQQDFAEFNAMETATNQSQYNGHYC